MHHDTTHSREEATSTPKARHIGVVPLIILIDGASIIVIALTRSEDWDRGVGAEAIDRVERNLTVDLPSLVPSPLAAAFFLCVLR